MKEHQVISYLLVHLVKKKSFIPSIVYLSRTYVTSKKAIYEYVHLSLLNDYLLNF